MTTEYVLRVREPEARRVEVEVKGDARGAAWLDLLLPVWTPGSYLVREHQRHVDGLTACDEAGRTLSVSKLDKCTWRITCAGAERVEVSYRLHCFELTVRTNHVDPTHAFLNPAASCGFFTGREGEPCSVRVLAPAGWQTWVALPEEGGSFQAHDYDELADSPFELGPASSHSQISFAARGVPHELVIWGKGDFDLKRLATDVQSIVDVEAELFGGLPYSEPYLFLLQLNDKGRGGLEHRRCCALLAPRFSFVNKGTYEDFLQLVAHEFFHLWNVKRLRPQAFTPYDWARENHTTLLWAMEGFTSTYEVMALRRAGLLTPERFLEIWAERITQLLRTPGRLRTPLAQASLDAWIKHYRPDESTANTTVSYYLKGSVVGFLLDLELRKRSGGTRSLDDLMRLLYERHGRAPGLPEEGVEKAALDLLDPAEAPALRAFFDRALRSTAELDIDSALAGVGLRAILHAADGPDDKGSAEEDPADVPTPGEPSGRAWLGAVLRDKGGLFEISSIGEGTPAQAAGLCAGDEICALDGFRSELRARLSRAQPGQTVRISVFRLDELIELRVVLGEAPQDTVTVVPLAGANEDQRRLRAQWLGGSWPAELELSVARG